MVHWIYILKCEDDVYYVGETTRLYRRFWEHYDGKGGKNTYLFNPIEIIAIYKMQELSQFFEYNMNVVDFFENEEKGNIIKYDNSLLVYFNDDEFLAKNHYFDDHNLLVENNIVECLMIHNKENWRNIRGGKYTKFKEYYKLPINNYMKEIPLCNCGIPCDVKSYFQSNFYFRCSKKNMWEKFRDDFDIETEPCNFYLEYKKDYELRNGTNKTLVKLDELYNTSYWLKEFIGSQYEFCIGGCGKHYDSDTCIKYRGRGINLCYNCFYHKNDELKNKYSSNNILKGKCLIDINSL